MQHRSSAAPTVPDLGLGEEPLLQAGTARKRPPEPLDLDQIETDQWRVHAYSTVTVFARFRG